jgi:hypothetical protein
MLFTRQLTDPKFFSEDAFSKCPAIYQEMIPGRRHLRLNCFGAEAFAAVIESDDLDWRSNLDVPIYSFDLPPELHRKAILILQTLGLEMGVFDLKEAPDGEWIWLEINPQGQFLFLEPLLRIPLTKYFTDFLIRSAQPKSGEAGSDRLPRPAFMTLM